MSHETPCAICGWSPNTTATHLPHAYPTMGMPTREEFLRARQHMRELATARIPATGEFYYLYEGIPLAPEIGDYIHAQKWLIAEARWWLEEARRVARQGSFWVNEHPDLAEFLTRELPWSEPWVMEK